MHALFPKFPTIAARGLAGGLLFAIMVLVGTGVAAQVQQPSPPTAAPGQSSQIMQQIAAKQAEIQQLNTKLQQIQEATMEENPELAQQRDDFVSLVDSKMAEAGHDPAASRDRMQDLQGQLQGGELSEAEQQQVGRQLRQEMNTMQQAQSQAMQGEEVRAERQTLNENLVSAMEEQNPETQELISELRTAQQEYQQLVSRARQQQQGAGEPPGS